MDLLRGRPDGHQTMIELVILLGIMIFGLVSLRMLAIAVEEADKSHPFTKK